MPEHVKLIVALPLAFTATIGGLSVTGASTTSASGAGVPAYDFEGSTDGWGSLWGGVSVADSSLHHYTGADSLAARFGSGHSAIGVQVSIPAGTVVTGHVWSPAAGSQVTPFVYDSSWRPVFGRGYRLAAGWNKVSFTIPSVTVKDFGIQSDGFAGALFIDDVSWSGASPTPAPTTPAPAPTGGGVSLSGDQVASLGVGKYHLQANEFNSSSPLSITSDGGLDFGVTTSGINEQQPFGAPGAYPDIYRGCHWGYCTANSGLPVSVPALEVPGTVTTTDQTATPGSGSWDDSYDIWFNPAKSTSDNSTGLEMMVWLKHKGSVQPAGSVVATGVVIGGRSWTVWENGSGAGGTITYVLDSGAGSVTNLDLGPLAADAVSRGMMSSSWYLIDVEAGFEIWQGARGNAVNSFNVCTGVGCS